MEDSIDILDEYINTSAKLYSNVELLGTHDVPYTVIPSKFVRKNIQSNLFDYQVDLSKNCMDFFLSLNVKKGLISLPTGAGKTRTVAASCLNLKSIDQKIKIAWLAPTKELLIQAKSTFYNLWVENPNFIDISTSNSYKNYNNEDILFSTPQEIFANKELMIKFDIIIFDEAHQSIAKTFNESINIISHDKSKILGISATPGRVIEDESNSLVEYFENNLILSKILGDHPVKFLQNRHVLSKPKFISLGAVVTEENERVLIVAKKLLENRSTEKSLVFTRSIEQGKRLTLLLIKLGLNALFIEGEMSSRERSKILNLFEAGNINVLVNQKLLSTGYDCPNIDNVYILGRINSPILFEQIVGRASRGALVGGSSSCKIYDFDNHIKIHGEPNSYTRYVDFGWVDASSQKNN